MAILKHAFNGRWLRRAWLDNVTGWVGDVPVHTPGIPLLGFAGVFSAQHGWAFAGGVFDSDAAALNATVHSLLKYCRSEHMPYGFQYICGPLENPGQSGGSSHRRHLQFSDAPGMWPAVNYPMILGLVAVNRTRLAWEEFERNTLHWQANVSPGIWIGLWTSADSVNADGLPSDWTNDFPAFCMHRHAWPLLTFRQMAGLSFTATGLIVRPALPRSLGSYGWTSSLASVAWDGNNTWSGHYMPSTAGSWTLLVDMRHALPEGAQLDVSVWLAGATRFNTSTVVVGSSVNGAGPLEVVSPHATSTDGIQFAIVADETA